MDGLAIAASLIELRRAVEGGFIRTAYQPTRDLIILRVSGSETSRILISPKDAAIHLTSLDVENPQQPSAFAMLLRKHLRGGRIASIEQAGWDRVVTFRVERREGSRTKTVELVAELAGLRGNVFLVRDGTVLGALRRDSHNAVGGFYRVLTPQEKSDPGAVPREALVAWLAEDGPARSLARHIDGLGRDTAEDILRAAREKAPLESVEAEVDGLLRDLVRTVERPDPHVDPATIRATFYPLPAPAERTRMFSEALDRVRRLRREDPAEGDGARAIRVHLQRVLGKRSRTVEKLRDWLDGSGDEERLRHHADLLLIHQSDLPEKASSVRVNDPATDTAVEIRLDPSLSAVENAQRFYQRSKRLRRGRPHVEKRLRRIEREVEALREAMDAFDAGEGLPADAERFLPAEARTEATVSAPARRFTIDGYRVLVGRNAAENDRLLREAAPDDVWMHARRVAGSHVIVRRGGRGEIPRSVLVEAAKLAARYSKAKGERRVEVSMAAAKHVRKPKRAPAGLVIVDHEDTLTVDPELREHR